MDLKKAVRRHTNLALKRENINKKISWKHVWKKYYLAFDDLRLDNDLEEIESYGLCNKATIRYVKRKRLKNKLK